jgi:hypothetical protein
MMMADDAGVGGEGEKKRGLQADDFEGGAETGAG